MEDARFNGLLGRASSTTVKPACPRVSTSAGADDFIIEVNHELLAQYQNSRPYAWQRANKWGGNFKKTGG
jgi:hypothetical protein